ncbi:MAG: hypothetical protein QM783_19960 [Phycisphaerales bacterium]
MGFNFQSAHYTEVFGPEHGEPIAAALRKRFGPDVLLGKPNNAFCMRDEMGWSWWSRLRAAAAESLGEAATRQFHAVDAWQGVYVDAPVDRELLWPGGKPVAPQIATTGKPSFIDRLRKLFGLAPKGDADSEMRRALEQAMKANGPREGERGALQVGSLPKLMAEAEAMLRHLNVQPTTAGVEAMLAPYAADDRCDDDPHIQCLGHLWLTGTHAMQNRQPLWLVK